MIKMYKLNARRKLTRKNQIKKKNQVYKTYKRNFYQNLWERYHFEYNASDHQIVSVIEDCISTMYIIMR